MLDRLDRLTQIGIALSSERDINRLIEMILIGAKELTYADGGTFYTVDDEAREVRMEIVRTDSLNFAMGGTTGVAIPFAPISLYNEQGDPNHQMVVTHAVLADKMINIPDAYNATGFDFSGTQKFDQKTGYRSRSFLTVPMKNHKNEIIGVLQLLNAIHPTTKEVIPFSDEAAQLTASLASQAAIALTNRRLIADLNTLLESLIQLIATAIDEKSPYTGGHCERVPQITMMLAEAAHQQQSGPFAQFQMSEEDRYELNVAAWLHDCGKLTTPEYVVDKRTKLETIYDRIETVTTRIELLKRDATLNALEQRLEALKRGEPDPIAQLESQLNQIQQQLDAEASFLERANTGGEFMDAADQQRVRDIGQQMITLRGEPRPLLNPEEIDNLTISRGTLTKEERDIINHHIVATIDMLNTLPFPKHLSRVPEYAGGHHERIDGKGYPKGLTGEQMSLQAKMMAIADIFEALTAPDRPYKEGKKLSEALKIMGFMAGEGHIDKQLFKLFIDEKIYAQYAERFIAPHQVDEIVAERIPNYDKLID
ncbi:GAF domain-containing protein [Ectothiorhodospiraceae bacterium BW-2]|nr:GAF domain-containing protein [Ectothiorhodospiraceae bacterium BW-2]